MDNGNDKIKPDEKKGIPHYMIDIKDPNESFTVVDFQTYVQSYIQEITKKGKLPILVGGSGLYIQAALYDYNIANQNRIRDITKRLEKEVTEKRITPSYKK